jgi:lipopolysaccharide transport system ATP-binding protein
MTAVQSLCDRAVLLEHGRVAQQGDVGSVVQAYLHSVSSAETTALEERRDRSGDGTARITSIRIESASGGTLIRVGSKLRITISWRSDRAMLFPSFSAQVNDMNNTPIFEFDSDASGGLPDNLPATGSVSCVTDALHVTAGRCYLNVALERGGALADAVEYAAVFDVEPDDVFGSGRIPERSAALCILRHEWMVA